MCDATGLSCELSFFSHIWIRQKSFFLILEHTASAIFNTCNQKGRHSKYCNISGLRFMSQEHFSYFVVSPECSHTRRTKPMLSSVLLGRWPLELCSLPPVISTCLSPTGDSCQMTFISECQHWNRDCLGFFQPNTASLWYRTSQSSGCLGLVYFCFKLPLISMGVKFSQCWMLLGIPPFSWFWFCWLFMSSVGLSNMCWHNISLEQNNNLLC